ncbi:WSCD family member CG9164-like isoform X2 [Dysidea avara]
MLLRHIYNGDNNLVRCLNNLTSVTCRGRSVESSAAESGTNREMIDGKAVLSIPQPPTSNDDIASEDMKLFWQRIRQISPYMNKKYIDGLSSSRIADIVRYMDIRNLNGYSAFQFLRCPGLAVIKQHMDSNGNLHIPKHYQTCKQMSFQEHGQVVGLVSFPGSGNSWVRQLLETTGVYTGSVYCDHAYIEAGMIGEGVRSGNVIAVKTHSCVNDQFGYSKRIYVVRNPFNAMFANFNRKVKRQFQNSSSSHVAEFNVAQFDKNSDQWTRDVTRMSNGWLTHIQLCLKSHHNSTLVVKFENLKANLMVELRRIFDFLGYHYTEDDLLCTIQSNSDQFHRKHTTDFDPYTPEQRSNVGSVIQKANELLSWYNITYPVY